MIAPYTLSASYRVKQCTASLGLQGAEEETEGQAAGTGRHIAIAAVAAKMTTMGWTEPGDVLEAAEAVGAEGKIEMPDLDWEALLPFLRPGRWAHNVSVAWHPESGAAVILGIGLTRKEKACKAEEWASARGHHDITHGEADVVGLTDDAVVVPDFKPPWGSGEHAEAWRAQVEGLAAALAAAYGKERAICAYLQLRPGARPVSWELDALDLDVVRARHAEVLRTHRAGTGTYSVGKWCGYCPGKFVCPQRSAMVRDFAGLDRVEERVGTLANAIRYGLLDGPTVAKVHEARKAMVAQLDLIGSAIEDLATSKPIQCGDGTVLAFKQVLDRKDGVSTDIALEVLASMDLPVSAERGEGVKVIPEIEVATRRTVEASVRASGRKPMGKIVREVMDEIERRGGLKKHDELKRFTPESS